MRIYVKPQIELLEVDQNLLSMSGPDAGDIGSPTVSDDAKEYSILDEVNETYNINKEEQDYGEDWN